MKFAAPLLFILLATALCGVPAHAQFAGSGRGDAKKQDPAAQPALPDIRPLPDPVQRLEPGALLCPTEAALRQHQAAVLARLSGRSAPEPVGCRILRDRTAVGVLTRDGQAATQVSIPGPPRETGWTDQPVREADQFTR